MKTFIENNRLTGKVSGFSEENCKSLAWRAERAADPLAIGTQIGKVTDYKEIMK